MDIHNAISLFSFPIQQAVQNTPSLKFYKDFIIRELNGKKFLVVQQNKVNESKEFMISEGINALEINMSLGYQSLDINFLKDFTFITDLNIVHQPLKETEILNSLRNLQYLALDSYFYSPIDFNNFPNLKYCSIHWTSNAVNLFSRNTLKELHIRSYKETNLSALSKLINLESFSVVNSSISDITHLHSLSELKKLKLALLKNLTSLRGIEYLEKLESLEIQNCSKIKSIQEIEQLSNLKELFLIDCKDIYSINPLSKLKELEVLIFAGTTNIVDGDLNPLLQLKKLDKILFQNRKHYSHRVDLRTNKLVI